MKNICSETVDVLNIHQLKQLSLRLGIPQDYLLGVASNIKSHYWEWELKQYNRCGTVKKSRPVYSSSEELEAILYSIDNCLLNKIKLHEVIHGAREGYSYVSNAEVHVNQKYVLNIDIKDFFPRISYDDVYFLFLRKLRCSSYIARLLTTLCTADGWLPQGYNTSPRIANLVLMPAVKRIDALCRKQGLKLSVYVDDITISGNRNPEKYLNAVRKILLDYGFTTNSKTICRTSSEQQKVTGIVVNEKLNIDKRDYRDIRAKIHICQKYGFSEFVGKLKNRKGHVLDTTEKVAIHLRGKLDNFYQINSLKAEPLRVKLEEAIICEGLIWEFEATFRLLNFSQEEGSKNTYEILLK